MYCTSVSVPPVASHDGERMQEGYSLQGSLYKQVLEAGEIGNSSVAKKVTVI